MILQSLVKYYDELVARGEISEPGWSIAKISYGINLDSEGNVQSILPLMVQKQKGKKMVEVPNELNMPEGVKRSSGVAAQFLWDNSTYCMGVGADDAVPKKRERTIKCFEAASEIHNKVLANATGTVATAIKKFFASWDINTAAAKLETMCDLAQLVSGSGYITFMVNNRYAADDAEVRSCWSSYKSQSAEGPQGRCLVTGELDTIARLHPSIKGVRGAQSSGASLVSFNALAYESYGQEQGMNAPVGTRAAFAYGTVLNKMLASYTNKQSLGDMTIVFWSEADAAAEDFFSSAMFSNDNEIEVQDIKAVMEGLSSGKSVEYRNLPINPDNQFYILGISPNAARLSVRFFYKNSFGSIVKNIKAFYDDLEIIRPSFDKWDLLPLWLIGMETVNKNSKDKAASPLLMGALLRSILTGSPYPMSLYQNILLRVKADQDSERLKNNKINRIKAAIIKACLLKIFNSKEVATTMLNEASQDTAYVLGRTFAVLEHLQEEANPGINSTIKDRYFNAACASPSVIFPMIMKLASSHLRKIRNERGKAISFEKAIGELQDKIAMTDKPIPARLSLEEQGKFILGYYHQVQKRYTKKEEK